MLSNDIIVDLIFPWLYLDDILHMREVRHPLHALHQCPADVHAQVSKLFYALTHHPSIWKRFLRNLEYPLAPIPPTRLHALGRLSAFEAERLVVRACSLDDNWRRDEPALFRCRSIQSNEQNDVLEIALVPGAHYMVASAAPYSKYFYRLTLYTLDNKAGGCIPIAEIRTGTKAYNLQARYMVHKGKQGIMITYTRRCIRHERDCDKGFVTISPRGCLLLIS